MSSAHILTALRKAEIVDDCELVPLNVTGNNRVFRVEAGAAPFLVKEYVQHPGDPRDRYYTERVFYSYLWTIGNRQIPEPLRWLPEERLACFEFLAGNKPTIATRELMEGALRFFFAINEPSQSASAVEIPSASEACFSMDEHIRCIERRVLRLNDIAPQTEFHEAAIQFAQDKIHPTWSRVRQRLEQNTHPVLTQNQRCLSPSDFGFHNSIVELNGTPRFFDFEYAGWDDPAKTVCDFFCQPTVPLPIGWLSDFTAPVAVFFKSEAFARRVELLLPAYQIKWCCIILNDFLSVGEHRRAFSNPNMDRTQRLRDQIAKCAKAYSEFVS